LPQTYVALDLETTGLDTENDSIIEVGAVRFSLDGKIDEFSTLVNPGKSLPPIVQRLTGITDRDLATAPPIEAVASDIEQFLAGSILVGHNVCGFDAPVLDAHRIQRPFAIYDTQQIAEIVMPAAGYYGLADLTASLAIGLDGHHRAMADAEASRLLFLALIEKALELPGETLSQIGQWLTPTALPWRGFFREVWELRGSRPSNGRPQRARAAESSSTVRPSRAGDPVIVPAEKSLEILRPERSFDVFEIWDAQGGVVCGVGLHERRPLSDGGSRYRYR
jgi:DNA polymerase III epsilon subunit family exonuclease